MNRRDGRSSTAVALTLIACAAPCACGSSPATGPGGGGEAPSSTSAAGSTGQGHPAASTGTGSSNGPGGGQGATGGAAGTATGAGGATSAGGASPGGSAPIADTANSIQVQAGAGRSDPEGVAPDAPSTSRITWKDARGADRTMVLYGYLYQYDFTFLGGDPGSSAATTRSANDDAYGHPGFGYVVSHNTQTGNSPLGKANAPTAVQTSAFVGAHHAIHHVKLVYDRDVESGGNGIKIPVVIDWFVATGRDHPVWAVTWKMGAVTNPNATDFDTYRMDTRGPYGSLSWDGAATRNAGDSIGGAAWGDFGLAFKTTSSPLSLDATWVYDVPNTVAFSQAWTETVNAEFGIVETKPGDKEVGYQDLVLGRQRGATSAQAYPHKGDCTDFGDARSYSMPCVDGWPYQMMNYDWESGGGKPPGEASGTKLMAWGSPYGFLGASTFDVFDYSAKADGTGDRSYATFIVAGPKCRYSGAATCDQPGDVANTLAAVDALAAATLTSFTAGSLVTSVPVGPGASKTKTIANGYDDTYGVYTLQAASDEVAWTFTAAASSPVKNPIFRIRGYTSTDVPSVTIGGAPVSVNTGMSSSGAFASLDPATHELWVTLNTTVSGAVVVHVGP